MGRGPSLHTMLSITRAAGQSAGRSIPRAGRVYRGSRWTFRLALVALCLSPFLAEGGSTNSWRVFRSLSSGATLGGNRVSNPGMEMAGSSPPLANWSLYGSGYSASTTTAHGGTRSLQCAATNATEVHGGYQTIVL